MNVTEMYLTILAGVLLADGVVDPKEVKFFDEIIKDLDKNIADSVREYIDGKKEITEDLIEKIAKETSKNVPGFSEIMRDCYLMAAASGEVHSTQVDFIKKFLGKVISDNQKIDEVFKWIKDSHKLSQEGNSLLKEVLNK